VHQKERRRQDILDEIEDWSEEEFTYLDDLDEDDFEREKKLAIRQLSRYAERYARLHAQFLDEAGKYYLDDALRAHALNSKGDKLAGYVMGLRAAAAYLNGEGVEALRYEGDLIATQDISQLVEKRARLEDSN
jgi:hypothetical protein